MGTKERRERDRDQKRELILAAAGEIVNQEGFDKLSIRKIAHKIEYSPAIIYHYFHDKDDILELLLQKGYQKILSGFQTVQEKSASPEDRIKGFARNYIHIALQNPEEYKSYLLSDSPRVLEHTSVLFKGAAAKRPAIGMLCQSIKEYCHNECTDDARIELTAQVIWAAIFGLIIRMITEKDLSEKQRQNLINHHIELVLRGMIPAGCQK